MTHTKGPWRYTIRPIKKDDSGTNPGGGSIHAPTDTLIFGRDPRKTVVYLPSFYKQDEQAEIEANAKLIEAAPDLLQALKALLTDSADRGEIRDDDGELFQDWKNAIIAIEKATGESLGYLE